MLTNVLSPRTILRGGHQIVVIAASTGGISALYAILRRLPRTIPAAIIVVLHRTPRDTDLLPAVLEHRCRLPVRVIEDGETIHAGHVYLAPANRHLCVNADGTFSLFDHTRLNCMRSRTDPLLDSVTSVFASEAVAVVLSGTGRNGCHGAKRLHDAGGFVIAQDEATCEQFGMPRAAIEVGAANRVLPIEQIATALVLLTRRPLVPR